MLIERLEVNVTPPYAEGSTRSGSLLSSSDSTVVEVDSAGNLIGHRNGEAVVRGSGGASIRVIVSAPTTLQVVPHTVELALGDKRSVEVLADGRRVPNEAIRWQTSDPTVAVGFGSTVQAGMSAGPATLAVTLGELRATLEVTVRAASRGDLRVEPGRLTLGIGGVQKLRVPNAYASRVSWTSSDPGILQPLQDGIFFAKAVGNAQACAVYGERRTCASITVTR